MKKILLSLVLLCLAPTGIAQIVSVGSTAGQCGQTVSVPVTIDAVSGLLSLEFRVAYDAARLAPASVTAGPLTSGFSVSNNASAGVLRVAMASGTPVSGAGTVANLSFTAAATATGSVPLAISDVLVNDVPRNGNGGAVMLTCVQAPGAPAPFSPANGAANVASPVTLQWAAAANATIYRLYFGTSVPPPLLDATTATSSTAQTQAGTTYYWMIQAVNDAGAAFGPTWSFTTAGVACNAPAAPSQPSAPVEAASGNPFDVTWGAVAAATQYVVEEASAATFAGATSSIVAAPVTHLSVTRSVITEATLYFRVRARNAAGSCNVDGPSSSSVAVRIVPRAPLAAGTRVLPVVGTVAGSLGSFFRTAMQLHNAGTTRITGRLVFHLQGSPGSAGDPSLAYSLAPGETHSYADIVAALGLANAIGSLDLTPDLGSAAPVSSVRIFNDGGTAGTTGMTLEQLAVRDAIQAGQRGILITPMDPAWARMNIGIRTLLDGVIMTVTVRDRLGAMIQSSQRAYPPTYFVQVPLGEFVGNSVLLGDEVVVIDVDAGSAIIYGASTDNTTQDPSVQIARPVE